MGEEKERGDRGAGFYQKRSKIMKKSPHERLGCRKAKKWRCQSYALTSKASKGTSLTLSRRCPTTIPIIWGISSSTMCIGPDRVLGIPAEQAPTVRYRDALHAATFLTSRHREAASHGASLSSSLPSFSLKHTESLTYERLIHQHGACFIFWNVLFACRTYLTRCQSAPHRHQNAGR